MKWNYGGRGRGRICDVMCLMSSESMGLFYDILYNVWISSLYKISIERLLSTTAMWHSNENKTRKLNVNGKKLASLADNTIDGVSGCVTSRCNCFRLNTSIMHLQCHVSLMCFVSEDRLTNTQVLGYTHCSHCTWVFFHFAHRQHCNANEQFFVLGTGICKVKVNSL